jgi:phenylacetate-CoA ligase
MAGTAVPSEYIPQVGTLPTSREAIERIQSVRKRVAFERAKTIPWYRGKLDHIDPAKLDERTTWESIPILTKDTLRQWDHGEFMRQFCAVPASDIAEYWRSGGTTGKPVFYPRSYADVEYGLISWGRSFPCIGLGANDLAHCSFPIGIHPAGQVWARSAQLFKVGMAWVGAGNAVPSRVQLDLIGALKPTVFMGMSSFALHLANLAEAEGIDLTGSTVTTIICSAETLSDAKREKLRRMWGANVFDVFGMSEAGLMGAENAAHDGIHIWTDLFYVEVVDPATGRQVPDGEIGEFCVTPLWTGHATPFLRWNSGDLVRLIDRSKGSGPYAELFPMIKHANRTTGFFKIRGVNVNHAELEDAMFQLPSITDFQAILETDPATSLERLKLVIEVKREADPAQSLAAVRALMKRQFEQNAEVTTQPLGTLAAEFEKSIKAPRFVDRRS